MSHADDPTHDNNLWAWHITLDCAAMLRDTAKVKVQYVNRADRNAQMTVGTLHLDYIRLSTLVWLLRRGGAKLTVTGSYVAQHPRLRSLGERWGAA